MTKYYTLDGKAIQENESLPQQFIQVSNGTALMWDFTEEAAKSSLVSSDLLVIVLGTQEVTSTMSTLDYLRQAHEEMYELGDYWMSKALSTGPYDAWARSLFQDGLSMARKANSLWPLIHLYRAHEMSYWALRRLAK